MACVHSLRRRGPAGLCDSVVFMVPVYIKGETKHAGTTGSFFYIVIPKPALHTNQAADIIRTLEDINWRDSTLGEDHNAESIVSAVRSPDSEKIDSACLETDPNSHSEKFAKRIEEIYFFAIKACLHIRDNLT